MSECKVLGEQIPRLVDAATLSLSRGSAAQHLDLISASEAFLQVAMLLYCSHLYMCIILEFR